MPWLIKDLRLSSTQKNKKLLPYCFAHRPIGTKLYKLRFNAIALSVFQLII